MDTPEAPRQNPQLEARLVFLFALIAQMIALVVPSINKPGLLWPWLEKVRSGYHSIYLVLSTENILLVSANLLWLVSPFAVRAYAQSSALRWLALLVSIVTTLAIGFHACMKILEKGILEAHHFAIVVAALGHSCGMIMIRKLGQQEEEDADL